MDSLSQFLAKNAKEVPQVISVLSRLKFKKDYHLQDNHMQVNNEQFSLYSPKYGFMKNIKMNQFGFLNPKFITKVISNAG